MVGLARGGHVIIGMNASALARSANGAGVTQVTGLMSILTSLGGTNRRIILISDNTINVNTNGLNVRRQPSRADKLRTYTTIKRYRLVFLCSGLFSRCNIIIDRLLFANCALGRPRRGTRLISAFGRLLRCSTLPVIGRGSDISIRRLLRNSGSYLSTAITRLVKTSLLVLLASASNLLSTGPTRGRGTHLVNHITRVGSSICTMTKNTNDGNANNFAAGVQTTRVTANTNVPIVVVGKRQPATVCGILSKRPVNACFRTGDE